MLLQGGDGGGRLLQVPLHAGQGQVPGLPQLGAAAAGEEAAQPQLPQLGQDRLGLLDRGPQRGDFQGPLNGLLGDVRGPEGEAQRQAPPPQGLSPPTQCIMFSLAVPIPCL